MVAVLMKDRVVGRAELERSKKEEKAFAEKIKNVALNAAKNANEASHRKVMMDYYFFTTVLSMM